MTLWSAADFDQDAQLDLVMDAYTNAFAIYRGSERSMTGPPYSRVHLTHL